MAQRVVQEVTEEDYDEDGLPITIKAARKYYFNNSAKR